MLAYISPLPHTATAPPFPRRLVLLGSTGSIGVSALKVVATHGEDFRIVALAGARNVRCLAEQAHRFRPRWLGVIDFASATALKLLLPAGYAPEILVGPEGYAHLARLPEADIVLSAQVGAAGLAATLAAAEAGKWIALANKESLVLAGDLIRTACHRSGAVLLPVDSEHNALFQILVGQGFDAIAALVLTASGGPFRGRSREELAQVTPAQALAHPSWSMGAKVSVDSATLMNKGLECIEAHNLYGFPAAAIEVVVHPQSVVHSLVEYRDSSFIAQLGPPDMQIPIAYCLSWPRRLYHDLKRLCLAELSIMTFEAPDLEAFPCLALALQALDAGPVMAIVLNAANEVAVELFLAGQIGFMDIPDIVSKAMGQFGLAMDVPVDLAGVIALDTAVRAQVHSWRELGAWPASDVFMTSSATTII
ncbi:1-deoxy-D-xylulose 5-phosphate reductoisomerase [Desulfovibrionales bacterium]